MGNMRLSIPEGMHRNMREHTELEWSDVARQTFEKKLKEIELAEKLLSESRLSKFQSRKESKSGRRKIC
jgi:rhamnose utilization protein RhaD (predicted bifunctional aldolase and dehydrogenase)